MDNTAQSGSQSSKQQPQDPQGPTASGGTVAPGTIQKEQEPVVSQRVEHTAVMPSETEPVIHPEAESWIEKSGAPELSPGAEKIGIKLSQNEALPVSTIPTGVVTLPMTEEEFKKGRNTGVGSSIRWLSTLVEKVRNHMKLLHRQITNQK